MDTENRVNSLRFNSIGANVKNESKNFFDLYYYSVKINCEIYVPIPFRSYVNEPLRVLPISGKYKTSFKNSLEPIWKWHHVL